MASWTARDGSEVVHYEAPREELARWLTRLEGKALLAFEAAFSSPATTLKFEAALKSVRRRLRTPKMAMKSGYYFCLTETCFLGRCRTDSGARKRRTEVTGRNKASPALPTTGLIRAAGVLACFASSVGAAAGPGDSALVYSTYLGGADYIDAAFAVAVDGHGYVYVGGYTWSIDFPTTPGAYDTTCGTDGLCNYDGGWIKSDAFIAKLDPTGSSLVYSTYLGGSESDGARGIAVSSAGEAYVTGYTMSTDFPTTPGAFQRDRGGPLGSDSDAFIVKLDSDGSLVYSTYLGGRSTASAAGIALAADGAVHVAGSTWSYDFPVTAGAFDKFCDCSDTGGSDAFVAKLDAVGATLLYSTFLGGSGGSVQPDIAHAIALDAAGNAYVAGHTWSVDFPVTPGAFDPTCGADGLCDFDGLWHHSDAFVSKLDATGSALVFSTYLGGSCTDNSWCDYPRAIAVDAAGNVYVAGHTTSVDFPTTPGAYDATCGTDGTCNQHEQEGGPPLGYADAFVSKLDPSGSKLVYSTYLGGADTDAGSPRLADAAAAIVVDSAGNAYVAGITVAADFPTTDNAYDTTCGTDGQCDPNPNYSGSTFLDAFVTRLDPTGSALAYSTYLGGVLYDWVGAMALGASGDLYVTGETVSADFPTTAGAFQVSMPGPSDAFVTRFHLPAAADLAVDTSVSGSVKIGEPMTYVSTVRNRGPDAAQNVVFAASSGGPPYESTTPLQGDCVGTGPVTCGLGALDANASTTITMTATASVAGRLVSTAAVTSDTSDPDLSNNSANVWTQMIGPPGSLLEVPASSQGCDCSAVDFSPVALLALAVVSRRRRKGPWWR